MASKREKRMKLIIYIMIVAMVLSTFTAGLAAFIN
ncbi:stressosome-associated protein Prli42 [Gracilibacillus orientalis]|nr:stressosome-associated protein Prli42 [Gracilibacillus orientalis]